MNCFKNFSNVFDSQLFSKYNYIYVILLFILGDFWILLNMLYDIRFTLCPFRLLTKLPCPFCGTTTATIYLLKGNLLDAFFINPLSFLTIPFLLLIKVLLLIDLILRKDFLFKFLNKLEFYIRYIYLKKRIIFIFGFMLIILNWIYLIVLRV